MSRDAVDFYPDFGLELQSYIARQSLISAFRPADPKLLGPAAEIASSFQRRMVAGDVVGNLREHIRSVAHKVDLLVWDLVDERLGVFKIRVGGGMVTRNKALDARGVAHEIFQGSYIFGTDAHFTQWTWALKQFVALLNETGLKDKVVVNATPWAKVDPLGQPFNSGSSLTPDWFNANAMRYYAAIESTGIKVAYIESADAIADPNHKWGPAYFHYVSETYRRQLEAITALL